MRRVLIAGHQHPSADEQPISLRNERGLVLLCDQNLFVKITACGIKTTNELHTLRGIFLRCLKNMFFFCFDCIY